MGCASRVGVDEAMGVCEDFRDDCSSYMQFNVETGRIEETIPEGGRIEGCVTKKECVDAVMNGDNPYSR
ncbi:MAG: hypothetical protein ABIA47_04855 [bacterium]